MLQKSGRLVLWEAMFILELHSAETQAFADCPFGYDPQIVCHTDHNSVLLPVVLFFFDSYCHAYLRAIFFRINICTSPADGGDHTGLIYRGNICV